MVKEMSRVECLTFRGRGKAQTGSLDSLLSVLSGEPVNMVIAHWVQFITGLFLSPSCRRHREIHFWVSNINHFLDSPLNGSGDSNNDR